MNNIRALINQLSQDIMHGQIALPSLPSQAVKVRDIVHSDEVDIGELVAAIEGNISIASAFIEQANQAFYRGVAPVVSVRQAIVRLGLDYAQTLIMRTVLKTLFIAQSRAARIWLAQHWQQSYWRMTIARYLGAWSKHEVGELTMMAMLYDIGRLPVVITLDQSGQAEDIYRQGGRFIFQVAPNSKRLSYLLTKSWRMSEQQCRATLVSGKLGQHYQDPLLDLNNLAVALGRGADTGIPVSTLVDQAEPTLALYQLDSAQLRRTLRQLLTSRDI